MKTVSIIKHNNYREKELLPKIQNILASSGILDAVNNKKVLLKPNCTGLFSPKNAKTTNPIFLRSIIKILQPITSDLVVGESSSVGINTIEAYKKTGIYKVCKDLNIKMIDFKKSKYKKIIIKGKILKYIYLPYELNQFDFIISITKLKTNYVSTISCSIKNLKGLLRDSDKRKFHEIGLSYAVADLYSSLDNVFGIVDGIVGNELYEPKKANIIIASKNIYSCDYVCAKIMRISPKKVEHLNLLKKNEKIKIIGEKLNKVKTSFKKDMPGLKYMEKNFNVTILNKDSCSNCIGSLYLSLKKANKINPNLLKDLNLNIGKNNKKLKTINFGNCSFKSGEINVTGCPPRTSEFIKTIRRLK